ncbi:MAG: M48 family metallopeptidase, partial [Verrucomicrobia bacterium]|nr:M48 family metallopeptidase [Verrucomicrobiota bacterium]
MWKARDHGQGLDAVPPCREDDLRIVLRQSTRARRLILRLLSNYTLEVVLPPGVDGSQVPEFLKKHAAWIRQARARQATDSRAHERGVPSSIHLRAVNEVWLVDSVPALGNKVRLAECPSARVLRLRGKLDETHLWSAVLQTWLKRRAGEILVPWLQRMTVRTGLTYRHATVRLQRSRWGSCSSRQRINLNARLLLVAPELVEYLLIHELCHTRELNHSARFWRLVELHCPEYRVMDRRLNLAGRDLPLWSQARE